MSKVMEIRNSKAHRGTVVAQHSWAVWWGRWERRKSQQSAVGGQGPPGEGFIHQSKATDYAQISVRLLCDRYKPF